MNGWADSRKCRQVRAGQSRKMSEWVLGTSGTVEGLVGWVVSKMDDTRQRGAVLCSGVYAV